jgi:hypothetical protein
MLEVFFDSIPWFTDLMDTVKLSHDPEVLHELLLSELLLSINLLGMYINDYLHCKD